MNSNGNLYCPDCDFMFDCDALYVNNLFEEGYDKKTECPKCKYEFKTNVCSIFIYEIIEEEK